MHDSKEEVVNSDVIAYIRRVNDTLRGDMPLPDRQQYIETLFDTELQGHLALYCRHHFISGVVERSLGFLTPQRLRQVLLELVPSIQRFIFHVQASHVIQTALALLPRAIPADAAAAAEGDNRRVGALWYNVLSKELCAPAQWRHIARDPVASKVLRSWLLFSIGRTDNSRRFVAVSQLEPWEFDSATAGTILTTFGSYVALKRFALDVAGNEGGTGLLQSFFELAVDPEVSGQLSPAHAALFGRQAVAAALALFGVHSPTDTPTMKDVSRLLLSTTMSVSAEAALSLMPRSFSGEFSRCIATFTTKQGSSGLFEHQQTPCLSQPQARALLCGALRRLDVESFTAITTMASEKDALSELLTVRGFGVLCALFSCAGSLDRAGVLTVPTGPLPEEGTTSTAIKAGIALARLIKRLHSAAGVNRPAEGPLFVRRLCGLGFPQVVRVELAWLPSEEQEESLTPQQVAQKQAARCEVASRSAAFNIVAEMIRSLPARPAAEVAGSVSSLGVPRRRAELLAAATDPAGGAMLVAFFRSGVVNQDQKLRLWRCLEDQTVNLALTPAGSFVVEAAFGILEKDDAQRLVGQLRRAGAQLSRTRSGCALWRGVHGAEFNNREQWWRSVQGDRRVLREQQKARKNPKPRTQLPPIVADAMPTDCAAAPALAEAFMPTEARDDNETEQFIIDDTLPQAGDARGPPGDETATVIEETREESRHKHRHKHKHHHRDTTDSGN